MHAENYFREGDLEGATECLKEQIRDQPGEVKYRIFYFQLLAVLGEWDRSLKQLDVIADLDAGALPMVHLCQKAIQCEAIRADVFRGRLQPTIFGKPPEWIALLIESLRLTIEEKYDQAMEIRNQAFEQADPRGGTINETPFEWIADADTRYGPVLEAILNGGYYWIPFERIKAIQIEPPEDLRDLVWLPTHFTWENGGQLYGLIPARYPGSESSRDMVIQLARKTKWRELSSDLFQGIGQRMLATDRADYPLFDVRNLIFSSETVTD